MTRRPPKHRATPAALDGAEVARQAVVKLLDRQDGQGVDWRAVADTLFKAAFDVLDRLPDEACCSVARRVHAGAYERMTEGPKADSAASKTDQPVGEFAPMNTTDLKSNGPDR
jgi:hypothetical protein